MRTMAILFVIAGVPIAQAGYVLAERVNPVGLYAVILVLLGAVALPNVGKILRRRSHVLFFGFFAVLLAASLLTAARESWPASYKQIVALATCFVWSSAYVVLFLLVRGAAHVQLCTRTLDAVGLMISLSVYAGYALPRMLGVEFGETVSGHGEERAFGPLGDQVGFVIVLFVLRSMVIGRWAQLAFHMGAVLATGTRGAVTTLLAGTAWLIIAAVRARWPGSWRIKRRVLFAQVCVALLLIGALTSSLGDTMYHRMLGLEWDRGAVASRGNAMLLGLGVFRENPILGVGFLGFRRETDKLDISGYIDPASDTDAALFTAQNQYIQTATDAGVLGVAVFVLFFWVVLRNVGRTRRRVGPKLVADLLGYEAWLVGILAGNQGAAWVLPFAATGYFVFLVAGLTERISDLHEGRAPERRTPGDPVAAGG